MLLDCRHHMAHLVRAPIQRRPLDQWPETCAHDVPRGPHSLEHIASLLGYTSQGIRHVEARATSKLLRAARQCGLRAEDYLCEDETRLAMPDGLEESDDSS
jgi:hypothetical protein